MKQIILTFITIISIGFGATAQTLIADINPSGDSWPIGFCEFNNELYFNASNDGIEYRLYKYDGISTVTLIPEVDTSSSWFPSSLISFNGNLIFSYENINGGPRKELWKYDGVNLPVLVSTIGGSYFIEYSGKLYFTANDGTNGSEMWVYDGVNPPTMVADLNTNSSGIGHNHSSPGHYTVFQNKLYFTAWQGTTYNDINDALMMYDGVNTPSVVDTNISASYLYNFGFSEINGKLYMKGNPNNTGLPGQTIYEYDGINPPAIVTSNLGLGQSHSMHSMYQSFLGILNFRVAITGSVYGRVWQYDLVNPADTTAAGMTSIGQTGVLYNNEVYYVGSDNNYPNELFKYDGINTPQRLTNLGASGGSINGKCFLFQNKIYFSGSDGISGRELMVYDPLLSSIKEHEDVEAIKLFPNPTNAKIIIDYDKRIKSIVITDYMGKTVKTIVSTSNTIDVSDLTKGIYFLQIETDKALVSKRFIKK